MTCGFKKKNVEFFTSYIFFEFILATCESGVFHGKISGYIHPTFLRILLR